MTANELANEAMEHYKAESPRGFNVNWMEEVAIMLRQQEAALLAKQEHNEMLMAEIERLIGSKPITYGMLTFCKNCGEQNPYQSKTLTDEEIQEIGKPFLGFVTYDELDFARAILRKAQKK